MNAERNQPQTMKNQTITFRLDNATRELLETRAKAEGKNLSEIIRLLCEAAAKPVTISVTQAKPAKAKAKAKAKK